METQVFENYVFEEPGEYQLNITMWNEVTETSISVNVSILNTLSGC